MSIGTKLYTWMYGKLVGIDSVGNKYYTNSESHKDLNAKSAIFVRCSSQECKSLRNRHANSV
jgi:NADH:ubiquinone oxidoreductase subunit